MTSCYRNTDCPQYTAYNLSPLHRSGPAVILVPRPTQCCSFEIARRLTTLGRTPLEEESARRQDLYLRKHSIYKRETSMPPAGFEPTIPASERRQTYTLDSAETRIGLLMFEKSILMQRKRNEWNSWPVLCNLSRLQNIILQ